MITLIRTLFNWYIYIAAYLCPQSLSGFKEKSSDSPLSSNDETELLVNNEYIDDDDREIYNRNFKQFMDYDDYDDYVTHETIKKSKSTSLPLHYCGWCGAYIPRATHLYMDNVFCNIKCRNYQITNDNHKLSREQKRQMTVSFSL